MMPHPERASDSLTGGTDGLKLFQGLLAAVARETLSPLSLAK
jgi:phosphoribosylformylglycinamidine synthase subunit PurQ / glutaminase